MACSLCHDQGWIDPGYVTYDTGSLNGEPVDCPKCGGVHTNPVMYNGVLYAVEWAWETEPRNFKILTVGGIPADVCSRIVSGIYEELARIVLTPRT